MFLFAVFDYTIVLQYNTIDNSITFKYVFQVSLFFKFDLEFMTIVCFVIRRLAQS